MNTKLDPFKYTNYLINNSLSAKKLQIPMNYSIVLKSELIILHKSQKSPAIQ